MFKRFVGLLALLALVRAACTPPAPPAIKVTSVAPAPGATAVSVASNVTATFNLAVTKATLDEAFTVSSGAGDVAGTVTYDTATRTATFTPASPLAYSTEYTASLSTALRSTAKGSLESAYNWRFSTQQAPGDTPGVSAVTVSPSTATLVVAATRQFSAAVTATGGASEDVTWASSDTDVATVDADGLVTAVAPGTATITATSNFDDSVSGSAEVVVLPPSVTTVTVDPAEATVDTGATQQFDASVATVSGADDTVTWTTSNPTVATIDDDGLATAVAPGTATITATSNFDDSVTGTATLNVAGVTAVAVDPAVLHLAVSQTGALTAAVTALHGADDTVTWASDDDTVATVDATGVVTAVAEGTAIITATSTVNGAATGTAAVTVHGPVTINHFLPLNVITDTGTLNADLGAAGGFGPYSYDYSLEAPAGWPVGYAPVPADYDPAELPFRLPPDGVTIDQDAGALVGSSDEVGDYRFFVVVTDALGQTDYALVELDFAHMFLTIAHRTYTYPVGCGASQFAACGGGGTFTVSGNTYSRIIPTADITVTGLRDDRTVSYTMTFVTGGGTGSNSTYWNIEAGTGSIGRRRTTGGFPNPNTSTDNNGTRTYTITAQESGTDGRSATATVVFEDQP